MGGGEAAWLPVSLVVTDLGSPCLLLSPVLLLLLSAPRLRLLAVPLGQVLAEKGSQFLSKLFDFKNPASVTRQPLQVPFDQTVRDFCDQQRTGSVKLEHRGFDDRRSSLLQLQGTAFLARGCSIQKQESSKQHLFNHQTSILIGRKNNCKCMTSNKILTSLSLNNSYLDYEICLILIPVPLDSRAT